jgi:uncharacterized repeat protein (TIGR01451 family)
MLGILLMAGGLLGPDTAQAVTFTVTNNNDSLAGSLRQAILDANANPAPILDPSVIVFSGNFTITLSEPTLSITQDLTLTGLGAGNTILSGAGGRTTRILTINGPVVSISGITVQNGAAGGISNEGGLLNLDDCLIQNNTAPDGGGIYNNVGTLFIQRSLLVGNQATTDGGGIYNNGVLEATNVTFSANTAAGLGGALRNLWATAGEVILKFATLAENTAPAGGGISNAPGGLVGLQSVLLTNNTGGNCAGDAVTSLGGNLDNLNTCGLNALLGDLPNTDPLLAAGLAGNGGPTMTYALALNSPAVNSGAACIPEQGGCPPTDQRGPGFFRPAFTAYDPPDIGAYELQLLANVDLAVTKTGQQDPITALSNLTYIITVTNNGPFVAHGVLLTDALDSSVSPVLFVSVSTDLGLCSHFAGIVSCNIPLLKVGETATISLVVTPTTARSLVNIVYVTPAVYETDPTPNSAQTTTTVNNPVPVITTLNPAEAVLNGPSFNLTVNGSNFVTGAVVRWNGADLPTVHVSSTQLTAAVPAANLALPAPGSAAITVFNPDPGGVVSNTKILPINLQQFYLPLIFNGAAI